MDSILSSVNVSPAHAVIGAVVATAAAYIALERARCARQGRLRSAGLWLALIAFLIASGTWSAEMLYIAALHLPDGYCLDGRFVGLAWVAGGGLGLLAVGLAGWTRPAVLRWPAASIAATAAVVGSQWLSIRAMQPGAEMALRMPSLIASIVVPALGAVALMRMCTSLRTHAERVSRGRQAAAALAFALCVVGGQHFAVDAWSLREPLDRSLDMTSLGAFAIGIGALALLASVGTSVLLLAIWVSARLEQRTSATLVHARQELRQRSTLDGITGLHNREAFEHELVRMAAAADAAQHRVALLFVDLDGFKTINETFGHGQGDRMLQETAIRLRAKLRPCDTAARLGGDQFLVLLGDSPRAEDVAGIATGLLSALGEPWAVRDREAAVTCSIGIALYPMHGATSTLISHADAAMRAAKTAGGATYCFFEPHMVSGAREQVELLRDLRCALSRGQLELYFQPKIHGPSGEITGAEALMRWHHPQRGMVSPAVFIPIAERFGLINTLGEWLIEEACRQVRAWRDQGLRMRVAINLSVHQLRQPHLADRIAQALEKHQVNPKLITCEITESVAMEDSEHTMRIFSKLAAVGVAISIDDFGTGYSSLAYLRKLPAEELKIDRSFVLDLETSADARAVVDAVVKLAQALGLKVVAEGVETEAQHQILRSLGCNELQGFLFAKPMSAKALALWAMGDVVPKSLGFRASLFSETLPTMEI